METDKSEFTYDDLYCLDLNKLDGFVTVLPPTRLEIEGEQDVLTSDDEKVEDTPEGSKKEEEEEEEEESSSSESESESESSSESGSESEGEEGEKIDSQTVSSSPLLPAATVTVVNEQSQQQPPKQSSEQQGETSPSQPEVKSETSQPTQAQ